uniref:ARAD1C28006p n=1 Tax=Blastobotrys adeninivorans TaxID=409370 RepID=A0A060T2U8_BLAAD
MALRTLTYNPFSFNSFDPFEELDDGFTRALTRSLVPSSYSVRRQEPEFSPQFGPLVENEDNYQLAVRLSDVNPDKFTVEYDEDSSALTISGAVEQSHGTSSYSYSFSNSFTVPNIREDEITANLDGNVLTISLPKDGEYVDASSDEEEADSSSDESLDEFSDDEADIVMESDFDSDTDVSESESDSEPGTTIPVTFRRYVTLEDDDEE